MREIVSDVGACDCASVNDLPNIMQPQLLPQGIQGDCLVDAVQLCFC